MYSSAYVTALFKKIMKLEAPLVFSDGFCSQDILEFSVIPNATQGESYSFMPCRMVHLRHFEILEFAQKMTPKGNTGYFRQGLFSNNEMCCC